MGVEKTRGEGEERYCWEGATMSGFDELNSADNIV